MTTYSRCTGRSARAGRPASWHYRVDQGHPTTGEPVRRRDGDHQWIHTDPERAAKGPFKGTIAHGYLTLSLTPMVIAQVLEIREITAALNYGLNKVRFPAPVRVGSQVRAGVA